MDFLFGFSGRIGRLQWWGAQLANFVLMVASTVAIFLFYPPAPGAQTEEQWLAGAPFSIFLVIAAVTIVTTWIGLASSIKRYHDRDKSGWWVLIVLVPLIGGLWQLIECGFLAGAPGGNGYGHRGGGERSIGDFGEETPRVTQASAEPSTRRTSVPAAPVTKSPKPSGFGRRGA